MSLLTTYDIDDAIKGSGSAPTIEDVVRSNPEIFRNARTVTAYANLITHVINVQRSTRNPVIFYIIRDGKYYYCRYDGASINAIHITNPDAPIDKFHHEFDDVKVMENMEKTVEPIKDQLSGLLHYGLVKLLRDNVPPVPVRFGDTIAVESDGNPYVAVLSETSGGSNQVYFDVYAVSKKGAVCYAQGKTLCDGMYHTSDQHCRNILVHGIKIDINETGGEVIIRLSGYTGRPLCKFSEDDSIPPVILVYVSGKYYFFSPPISRGLVGEMPCAPAILMKQDDGNLIMQSYIPSISDCSMDCAPTMVRNIDLLEGFPSGPINYLDRIQDVPVDVPAESLDAIEMMAMGIGALGEENKLIVLLPKGTDIHKVLQLPLEKFVVCPYGIKTIDDDEGYSYLHQGINKSPNMVDVSVLGNVRKVIYGVDGDCAYGGDSSIKLPPCIVIISTSKVINNPEDMYSINVRGLETVSSRSIVVLVDGKDRYFYMEGIIFERWTPFGTELSREEVKMIIDNYISKEIKELPDTHIDFKGEVIPLHEVQPRLIGLMETLDKVTDGNLPEFTQLLACVFSQLQRQMPPQLLDDMIIKVTDVFNSQRSNLYRNHPELVEINKSINDTLKSDKSDTMKLASSLAKKRRDISNTLGLSESGWKRKYGEIIEILSSTVSVKAQSRASSLKQLVRATKVADNVKIAIDASKLFPHPEGKPGFDEFTEKIDEYAGVDSTIAVMYYEMIDGKIKLSIPPRLNQTDTDLWITLMGDMKTAYLMEKKYEWLENRPALFIPVSAKLSSIRNPFKNISWSESSLDIKNTLCTMGMRGTIANILWTVPQCPTITHALMHLYMDIASLYVEMCGVTEYEDTPVQQIIRGMMANVLLIANTGKDKPLMLEIAHLMRGYIPGMGNSMPDIPEPGNWAITLKFADMMVRNVTRWEDRLPVDTDVPRITRSLIALLVKCISKQIMSSANTDAIIRAHYQNNADCTKDRKSLLKAVDQAYFRLVSAIKIAHGVKQGTIPGITLADANQHFIDTMTWIITWWDAVVEPHPQYRYVYSKARSGLLSLMYNIPNERGKKPEDIRGINDIMTVKSTNGKLLVDNIWNAFIRQKRYGHQDVLGAQPEVGKPHPNIDIEDGSDIQDLQKVFIDTVSSSKEHWRGLIAGDISAIPHVYDSNLREIVRIIGRDPKMFVDITRMFTKTPMQSSIDGIMDSVIKRALKM